MSNTYATAGAQESDPRQPRHLGAGMNIAAELVVMEAIALGMQLLAESPDAARECVDLLSRQGEDDPEEWRVGMLAALHDLVDPRSDHCLDMFDGYDLAVANMPSIHLANGGGGENTAEAEVGDILGKHHTIRNAIDPDNPLASVDAANPRGLTPPVPLADNEHVCVEHTTTGVGQTTQVMIACLDPAAERALLIQAAVRWALVNMRGHMSHGGIHEFSWSEGAIEPSMEMDPRPVSYIPTITVTLHWTFRSTRAKIVPNRFTVTTRFSN